MVLPMGIALIVISFLVEGLDIIPRTAAHVFEDLTADLAPHLFLLGIVMILYVVYSRKNL